MKTYIFKVIIEKDFFEDGREAYHAYAPALKGAATWGYTKEEAINNIKEVIQMVVESKIEHHEPLPSEDAATELVTVSTEPKVSVTV
ncbi:MAG: type II toxin-antitoxin system HicB family antitoxin [Methanophagales archaeon]|nr:type II toxin-antitoxin system HicB family antitoxin [Methanophagales archaeon]